MRAISAIKGVFTKQPEGSSGKLGELEATAICGNDITSSCLYVSAYCILEAGQYAFVSLLIVGVVLFFFRKIYGEAVGALPLNGGAYNILLNTTSKSNASIAACLTILSYMATAVISASSAMYYLYAILPYFPVILATLVLLTLFLFLTINGIKESSKISLAIFIFHLVALTVLIGSGIFYVAMNGIGILKMNFATPIEGSLTTAIFLGFSAGMLGVTGFETSANFVEEQRPGVFRKTLRNMWYLVIIINPLIAIVAVSIIPLGHVAGHEETFLSYMAMQTGGKWLATIISIDAAIVLSGAVVTAFIGVNGLMKRMTLDRIFPQRLLKENKKGATPRILILFYILCVSILLVTGGAIGALSGVYTISFLTVMIFFGIGNLLLKIKRSKLPRPEVAKPTAVIIGVVGVMLALLGNMKIHPKYLVVFIQYFLPSVLIIYIFLKRKSVIQYLLIYVNSFFDRIRQAAVFSRLQLTKIMNRLNSQSFVYFSKGDNISTLNKVIQYVEVNEITRNLKIVTIYDKKEEINPEFERDLKALERAYPDIRVEYIEIHGIFGPKLIDTLSEEWNIPKNFMFIGSPTGHFPYEISELGGVRLII